MSTTRPVRAAKQIALDNIKKQLAMEDTYDEYGFPLASTPAAPAKVTLKDVEDAYRNSAHFIPIYALYPPEFREDLMEDDIRIDYCIEVLTDIVEGKPLVNTSNKTYQCVIDYYRNHTEDAAQYVLYIIFDMQDSFD